MSLLNTGLQAIFGAAFARLYLDATLRKVTPSDDGSGGYQTSMQDYPIKAMAEQLSEKAMAASGLPRPAFRLSVLQAGLTVAADLGDLIILGAATYRIVGREQDPAAVAWSLDAVAV